jgi:hypothetical protein
MPLRRIGKLRSPIGSTKFKGENYVVNNLNWSNNMARTKRGPPYSHYWGWTKQGLREWIDNYPEYPWADEYKQRLERDLLLIDTDSRNVCPPTREWFNRAHRVGRRMARDSLRPHLVMDEDYDFDDSHYRRKLKGVWWEIY